MTEATDGDDFVGDIKLGEAFGMEAEALKKIDFELSIKRILTDVKSDFIYAPHLNLIYSRAAKELEEAVRADIKASKFAPGIPIEIEVPKSFRIPVESTKRLGPSYSRPGSILLPKDRLLYQALADNATDVIDASLDDVRSFSHQLAAPGSPTMFKPTRKCWNDMQVRLKINASKKTVNYVMKLDVANYFSSINQHMLINVLNDAGFPKAYSSRLEGLLTSYTGERSSRGILQGMFSSDLFGNFYMAPIDRMLRDQGILSVRYVDDLYVFVESVDAAEKALRQLIPALRTYDLSLNESKSKIVPKSLLNTMEPDLEALFQAAVDEISGQVEDEDFDADYGFQSEWNDEDDNDEEEGDASDDEKELILKATMSLFDSLDQYPGQEENVERFCLPLFAKAESDYAVPHVLDAFRKRPAMSQIYSFYLAKFLDEGNVREFLAEVAADSAFMDWQRMWTLAALMRGLKPADGEIKVALDIARDGTRGDALRAVGAYFVGRFGDYGRRTDLRAAYPQTSTYVQAAIYASSRFWPGVERANARAAWATHSSLHVLLTAAMKPPAAK